MTEEDSANEAAKQPKVRQSWWDRAWANIGKLAAAVATAYYVFQLGGSLLTSRADLVAECSEVVGDLSSPEIHKATETAQKVARRIAAAKEVISAEALEKRLFIGELACTGWNAAGRATGAWQLDRKSVV